MPRRTLCSKRAPALVGDLIRAPQRLLSSWHRYSCGFALNSRKQKWEIPGTETLLITLLYCPSLGDSAVGKSQLPKGRVMREWQLVTQPAQLGRLVPVPAVVPRPVESSH